MYDCPNCGGGLTFDIPSQQLKCEYCGGAFAPEEVHREKDAEESHDPEFQARVFVCPQCGGQVISEDDTAAGFCSFCGASTILDSRIDGIHRPQHILPFTKTKTDCKEAYAKLVRHALFAPKVLTDPEHLEQFRGIYAPYWVYAFSQNKQVVMNGTREYRRGDYIIKDRYDLRCDLSARYDGISYDASSALDDEISAGIAPFDTSEVKSFEPSYLSGFYADIADVPETVYEAEATSVADEAAWNEVSSQREFSGKGLDRPSSLSSAFGTRTESRQSALFPIWFMTYRDNDRIAYAVVNGQTGRITADLPVDLRKFFLGSLLLAVPITILLNLFLVLTGSQLLGCAAALCLLAVLIYFISLRTIIRREKRLDDLGYQTKHSGETAETAGAGKVRKTEVKEKARKLFSGSGMDAVKSILVLILILSISGSGLSLLARGISVVGRNSGGILNWGLSLGSLILIVISLMQTQNLPDHHILQEISGCIAATMICLAIRVLDPADDLWFYGGAMLSFVCIALSFIGILLKHNALSTRPLPHYFDRKGGDDHAPVSAQE